MKEMLTIQQFQNILLALGVTCHIRCIGARGWTVGLQWESGASVIATGDDLRKAILHAINQARSVRPLTNEEQSALDRALARYA